MYIFITRNCYYDNYDTIINYIYKLDLGGWVDNKLLLWVRCYDQSSISEERQYIIACFERYLSSHHVFISMVTDCETHNINCEMKYQLQSRSGYFYPDSRRKIVKYKHLSFQL